MAHWHTIIIYIVCISRDYDSGIDSTRLLPPLGVACVRVPDRPEMPSDLGFCWHKGSGTPSVGRARRSPKLVILLVIPRSQVSQSVHGEPKIHHCS